VKSEPQWDCYDHCDTSSTGASNAEQYAEEANSHDLWDQNSGYLEPVVQCTVKEEVLDTADIGMISETDPGLHLKVEPIDLKMEGNLISNSDCEIMGSTSDRQIHIVQDGNSGTLEENQFLHKCHICPKAFKRKFQLTEHMRTHTGNLPYKCPHCSKSFARKFSLKDHLNLHTGAKPYSCTLCQKAFARRVTLNVHIKAHTSSKVFKCEICQI
jgi:hypothetical protein